MKWTNFRQAAHAALPCVCREPGPGGFGPFPICCSNHLSCIHWIDLVLLTIQFPESRINHIRYLRVSRGFQGLQESVESGAARFSAGRKDSSWSAAGREICGSEDSRRASFVFRASAADSRVIKKIAEVYVISI